MAWGISGNKGVTDLVEKIRNGNQTSMYILPIRKLSPSNAVEIANALKENKTITEFYASGHDIGIEGIQAFADMLKYNTTIQKICIGSIKCMNDEGITILCRDGLMHNKGLVELDLEHKNFGTVGVENLCHVIKIHPTLQLLNVSRNQLNDDAINLLCQSLQFNNRMETLLLNDNSFGKIGIEALADVLPRCNLRHLSLAHNNIKNGQEKFGKALVASNISYINLESCDLSSDFTQAMTTGSPAKQHSITEINLSHNSLSLDGMKHMEKILRGENQLRKINLGYNSTGDDGALQLATALQNTDHALDLLDLSCNNLTSTSIKKLFQLNTIKQLRLFKNHLGSGANDVVKDLINNTSLEVLDLCVNDLHGEYAACILDCLITNKHLKVLEFGGNNLNDVGRASLEKLKCAKPTLNVAVNKKGDDTQN